MAERARGRVGRTALASCVSLAVHASAIPLLLRAVPGHSIRPHLEVDLIVAPRLGRADGKLAGRGLGQVPPRKLKPKAAPAEISRKDAISGAPVPDQETVHAREDGGPAGLGAPNGTSDEWPIMTRLPALLNVRELLISLRRLYPVEERRAGRQSRVVLELDIDVNGAVVGAHIAQSGGTSFDAAALELAKLLRFSPACNAAGPVAVRIRQAIDFKLEA